MPLIYSRSYPAAAKQFSHSFGLKASMASAMALLRSAFVRAAALRSRALSFEKAISMGLKSGLQGGRYSSLTPTASINSRTPPTLCDARLSMECDFGNAWNSERQGVHHRIHGPAALFFSVVDNRVEPLSFSLVLDRATTSTTSGFSGNYFGSFDLK